MRLLLGLAILLSVLGLCILFKLTPTYLEQELRGLSASRSLRKLVRKKHNSKLVAAYESTVTAMKALRQTKSIYSIILLTIVLVLLGGLSGLALGNSFLSPVFAIGFATVPFIYIRVQYLSYKTLLVDEMETALSVVTSSYERKENILLAFEENMPHINEPLKSVFDEFLVSVKHTGINIIDSLEAMKSKISHPIFISWVDELKRCHSDRNLKVSLQPIVNRITDLRMATAAAKIVLYEVRNEFWSVAFLSGIFMFITYFVAPSYFGGSATSTLTQIMFAVHLLLLIIFSARAFLLTKDIKFEL